MPRDEGSKPSRGKGSDSRSHGRVSGGRVAGGSGRTTSRAGAGSGRSRRETSTGNSERSSARQSPKRAGGTAGERSSSSGARSSRGATGSSGRRIASDSRRTSDSTGSSENRRSRDRNDRSPNGVRRSSGDGRRRREDAGEDVRTEAQRRRAAVRARGAGSVRDPKTRIESPREVVPVEPEIWVDEGPVRERASAAVRRGRSAPRQSVESRAKTFDPSGDAVREVSRVADPRRAAKLAVKLESARFALDRERYTEAKRIARTLIKELAGVAAVHEVVGLASYRLGQWRDATAALEMARNLSHKIENLPVLADCYRAQKRWNEVDFLWQELKEESPSPEVMAEGRIVVAGSLADRGDLPAAIDLMKKTVSTPRRVREYHLRQWYVLADLYDRAGDIQRARELFVRIAAHDPSFADVGARISSL